MDRVAQQVAETLLATRPGQLLSAISPGPEVVQMLPNSCPKVAPAAKIPASAGQLLAEWGPHW